MATRERRPAARKMDDDGDETENVINKANQFVFYYMGQWFSIAFNFTLAVSSVEVFYAITQVKKAFSGPDNAQDFNKNVQSILDYLMPVSNTAITPGSGLGELAITGPKKWALRAFFSFIFVSARIDRVFLPMQFLGKMIQTGNDLRKFAIVPLTTKLTPEEAKDQCDEVRLSICVGLFSKICGLLGACVVFNRAPSMRALFLDASFYLTLQQIFDAAASLAESLPGLAGVKQTLVLKSNQRGASSRGRGILVTILTCASIYFTWLMENPIHTWAQRRKVMFFTSVVPMLISLGIFGFHHLTEFLIQTGRSYLLGNSESNIKDEVHEGVDDDEVDGEKVVHGEEVVDEEEVMDDNVDGEKVVDEEEFVEDDVVDNDTVEDM